MLKFLKARTKRILKWIHKNKIEVLEHILILYIIIVIEGPEIASNQFFRIAIVIIYVILQLIVAYFRATDNDSNILSKFTHKRFTEDTASGLVKFDKNRLEEMIMFVYDLENEMDHLIVVERNRNKK